MDRGPPAGAAPRTLGGSRAKWAKNGLIYWLVRGLLVLLALVPAGALPRLLRGLGALAAHLARRERGRALRNMAASELGISETSALRLWRRLFAHVGRSLGECLVLSRGGKGARALRERVAFAPGSLEALQSALAQGRGAVLAGAHFGNWELLASVLASHARLHVLARPSYDPRFSRLLERMRARLGCETIWVRGGRSHLRPCLAALGRGEAVALTVDQPAPASEEQAAERIPFLGRPAPTDTIAASLAHGSGAALLLVLSERVDGGHRVLIESIELARELDRGTAARKATVRLGHHLEEAVARRPDQWLWSLDRWREGSQ